jgi:DNA-binding transcriptional regulator YiaG
LNLLFSVNNIGVSRIIYPVPSEDFKRMEKTISLNHSMPFGQMLRKMRSSLELTLEELAGRFSVTVNDIELFERGTIVGSEAERKILLQMYRILDLS